MCRTMAVFVVLLLLLGSCSWFSGEQSLKKIMIEPLGQEFLLAFGETKAVRSGEASLHIHFSDLIEDSRCPEDVYCIRAGDVIVGLSLSLNGASEEAFDIIEDPENPDLAMLRHHQFLVKLLRVSPLPRVTKDLQKSEYVVGLQVTTQ